MITFALATDPDDRLRRRGRRLQPRQLRQGRDAVRGRLDRAHAVARGADLTTGPAQHQGDRLSSRRCCTGRKSASVVVTPTFTNSRASAASRSTLTASGKVPTTFTKVIGQEHSEYRRVLAGRVGHEEARAGARARQHRLDGVQQQDDRAQEGRQGPDPDASRRPPRTTTTSRSRSFPFAQEVNVGTGNVNATWLNWDEWNEENGDDISTTTCTSSKGKKKKCTTSKTWVPDDHKHLERLRDGPRPGL